jgi:nucleoside-diphosphate-sugar epimerase
METNMEIVVTGAAGFLGRRLIRALPACGELSGPTGQSHRIEKISAFDVVPLEGIDDPRVESFAGMVQKSHIFVNSRRDESSPA